MIETWEVAIRRIIEEFDHGLSAGYSYDLYRERYDKSEIPILVKTDKVTICIGQIEYGESLMDVYGRNYTEMMTKLAAYVEEKMGYQYKPILRQEKPKLISIRNPLSHLLWKAFGIEP